MAIKKSALYSSLWKSCDELRGGMDASQYKDYILVLLFMKYVSDKYGERKDALIEIPQGGSFQDMVSLIGKPEIGEGINKIIKKLAEKNEELTGVVDVADFEDDSKLGKDKDMQDRLSNLVSIFKEKFDFSKNKVDARLVRPLDFVPGAHDSGTLCDPLGCRPFVLWPGRMSVLSLRNSA